MYAPFTLAGLLEASRAGCAHTRSLLAMVPAGQMPQLVELTPRVEYPGGAHIKQWRAWHLVNLPRSQVGHLLEPAGECMPGGQALHVPRLLLPRALDAVPAGHAVHKVRPARSE